MTAVDGIGEIIGVFSPLFGKLVIAIEDLPPGTLICSGSEQGEAVKLTIDP